MNIREIIAKNNIAGISADSKEIHESYIFVAIKGEKHNGNDYIHDVVQKGAKIVITDSQEDFDKYHQIFNLIKVKNSRRALAEFAAEIYSDIPNNLLAVTGTNGKSSVVDYIGQMASMIGEKAATIGTLGIKKYLDNKSELYKNTGLTTIDVSILGKELEYLSGNGFNICAMEASSIGLDQYRLYGRNFKVAGFTSFTQDHLDYHGNMKSYLDAKLKLFSEHQDESSIAIINSDITEYTEIARFLTQINRRFITYGKNGDCKIIIEKSDIDGQFFLLKYNGFEYKIHTKIIGEFQIGNIVLALLMLENIGFNLEDLAKLVPNLSAPNGRLERICESKMRIFIDYAHSPDALENVLFELKKAIMGTDSKLWLVFGCGGDRDKIKRKIMGEIASKMADFPIVTDDNPRSESPELIRKEIISGMQNYIEIADREQAISHAIYNMDESDILLIAGKGHEEYQITKNGTFFFSDKKTAEKFAKIRKNGGR